MPRIEFFGTRHPRYPLLSVMAMVTFNQDWEYLFPTLSEGMDLYLNDLSLEEKRLLHGEIVAFIYVWDGRSEEEQVLAWVDLGGEAVVKELGLTGTLRLALRKLEAR